MFEHGWELGLDGTYNWLHVFEDLWVGLYDVDRGCMGILDHTVYGLIHGCSGGLRGADCVL